MLHGGITCPTYKICGKYSVHVKNYKRGGRENLWAISDNARHDVLYEYAVRAMRKHWNYVLKVATLLVRNKNEGMVASGGVSFGGILNLESGVGFMLVFLLEIWLQSPWKCFHIYFKLIKTFYNCTFNVICKENAGINCINVQQKTGLFLSNISCHTTIVIVEVIIIMHIDGWQIA
jgi:hypothetical protein